MECATTTATTTELSKPSLNLSEIVSKFAKVCKLRSVGVFSNDQNPIQHSEHQNKLSSNDNIYESNDGSLAGRAGGNGPEQKECITDEVGLQPQSVVVPSAAKANVFGEKELIELFDRVSALKLAYVQLQQAHVPYDPNKIVAADEIFVAQLEALSKIKRKCKEKKVVKVKADSSRFCTLQSKVKEMEGVLAALKEHNRNRDVEIVRLKKGLHDLELSNAVLAEKKQQEESKRKIVLVLNSATFEDAVKAALKSIHEFAKPLINLMKASGWDLDRAVSAIETGVTYSRRSHKKYIFEAYIARRMFHGVLLKSYDVGDLMRHDDPITLLMMNPNSEFANFCRKKYLFVVHPLMEMSFFGNLDQRMFILSGKHPRTLFYQIFARMAKWVWVVQAIATTIDPKAEIFSVRRGTEFSNTYMESAEDNKEGEICENRDSCRKVEFMIMPGFRIGSMLVKSRVYLSEPQLCL